LGRRPAAITLFAIREVIDGTADLEGCASGLGRCSDNMPCPQHERFKPLRVAMNHYLASTTVADMSRALAEKRALLAERRAARGKPVSKTT
jgi:DNA-binding IscR family transcriptional regulator